MFWGGGGDVSCSPALTISLHLHTTHAHIQSNLLSVSLPGPGSLTSASISNFKKEKERKDKQTLQQTPNSDATFPPHQEFKTSGCVFFPLLQYIHFGVARHGSLSGRCRLLKELHIKSVRLPLIECRAPFLMDTVEYNDGQFCVLLITTSSVSFPPSSFSAPSSLGLKQCPPKTTVPKKENSCRSRVVECSCLIV